MADRSRRRCVLRKTAVPDATHYVGYVEDDETPEMIMKKFEEMERIKAASRRGAGQPTDSAGPSSSSAPAAADSGGLDQQPAAAGAAAGAAAAEDGPLDEQQLQEVFKATSMYNIKSLLGNNEALMESGAAGRPQPDRGTASDFGLDSESEDDLVAELRGFWSDADYDKPSKKRDRTSKRAKGEAGSSRGRVKGMQRNARTCIIAQYNRDTHAFIRRRVRVADPDAILQLRLPPPPLPLSWGKAIRPYQPAASMQLDASQAAGGAAAAAPAAAAGAAGAMQLAGEAGAVVPRGLVGQPLALPASRNCTPSVHQPGSSTASSAGTSGAADTTTSELHVAPDLTAFDFRQLRTQSFQAVLINTGWESPAQQQQQQDTPQQQAPQQQQPAEPGPSSQQAAEAAAGSGVASWGYSGGGGGDGSSSSIVSRLEALPIPQLCPKGFIMIWANKEHLSAVFRLMGRWGYSYVENLTWVLLAANHSILRLPCPCVQRSHITLYIFRRDGEGRDIELRHQRNPDVVFDYVRAVEGREWDVPVEVFDSIETLLPTGKGLFLELWAPTQAGRAGWTHVVEQQAADS